MLNPMLPDEVMVKRVPRQKFAGFSQIFVLNQVSSLFFSSLCIHDTLKRSRTQKPRPTPLFFAAVVIHIDRNTTLAVQPAVLCCYGV